MPRVVYDQRTKFHTDALFKQLRMDSEVRYTGHTQLSLDERRCRFRTDCHEGRSKIGFVCNGINICLSLPKAPGFRYTTSEFADFGRERGKVHLKCPLIFNGVCVKFCGCLDVERLAGFGHLEFDEQSAQIEDKLMRETLRKQSLRNAETRAAWPTGNLYLTPNTSRRLESGNSSCIYESFRMDKM